MRNVLLGNPDSHFRSPFLSSILSNNCAYSPRRLYPICQDVLPTAFLLRALLRAMAYQKRCSSFIFPKTRTRDRKLKYLDHLSTERPGKLCVASYRVLAGDSTL